jgi:outer membrane protein OmpA-like peptidoglycan-associated protein
MRNARKRATGLRLAVVGFLSLGLTACDGGVAFDFSNFFIDFEPPAPVENTIEYYDITTSPFLNAATFATSEWDSASVRGSTRVAEIAASITELANRSEGLTVEVEGHADMRCTESTWQRENDGPNPNSPTGKWCSPRDANGVTPQGKKIGYERARTVARAVLAKLSNEVAGKVTFNVVGVGELGHRYRASECGPRNNDCRYDHRVDVYVSSRTCAGVCDPVDIPSNAGDGGTSDGGGYTPPPPTCLELGTCPADPTPTLDAVRFTGKFSSYAQQSTDQAFKFSLNAVTCNNGQQAPCGVPTSGEMRTGVAMYVTSSSMNSFTITPPSGYTSPTKYKITSNPAGSSLGSGATAKVRFYAATRAAAPYAYSASATVTVEWRSWQWDGSTMTVTGTSSETVPATLVCSPTRTPSCSFGVLGSNTVG